MRHDHGDSADFGSRSVDASKRVVLLTGSELRHVYFRKVIGLSTGIRILRSYCEGFENSVRTVVEQVDPHPSDQIAHLDARARCEHDFFGAFVSLAPETSNPVALSRGAINDASHYRDILGLCPDLIGAYGCSIIREPLISAFEGRFLNVHLGLSPYYRGSGTNFQALANGEPEYVGATFMHLGAGIDKGEIIHQIRARIYPGDSPHQIGNRLIADMAVVYAAIIRRFDDLSPAPQLPPAPRPRVYRNRDFTQEATRLLYRRFATGLIDRYLAQWRERCEAAPIVTNPVLADVRVEIP
jgi:hypothetical protein